VGCAHTSESKLSNVTNAPDEGRDTTGEGPCRRPSPEGTSPGQGGFRASAFLPQSPKRFPSFTLTRLAGILRLDARFRAFRAVVGVANTSVSAANRRRGTATESSWISECTLRHIDTSGGWGATTNSSRQTPRGGCQPVRNSHRLPGSKVKARLLERAAPSWASSPIGESSSRTSAVFVEDRQAHSPPGGREAGAVAGRRARPPTDRLEGAPTGATDLFSGAVRWGWWR
jgi:hypothetical protein